MKKKSLLLILLAVAFCFTTNAQQSTFVKGDKVINLGIGFGNLLYSGLGYQTTIPPLSISGEYGVADGVFDVGSIGVGAYGGFTSYKYESSIFTSTWGTRYTTFIVAARGTFHYPLIDKFDTYAGLNMGLRFGTSTSYGNVSTWYTPSANFGPVYAFFIGGRYYFTDKLAGMMELGYGISYVTVGLAFKL